MMVFDERKTLDDIEKNGIGATDLFATKKINLYIENLLLNSTYKKGKILEKVKTVTADYFMGLPDEIVQRELNTLYEDAKNRPVNDLKTKHAKKIITLYNSEMEHIVALKDIKLIKLAFATLVIHKFQGYYIKNGEARCCKDGVAFCKSDAFHLAGLDSTSGQKKNELWRNLAELGYLSVDVINNRKSKYTNGWIAMSRLIVPYNVDILPDSDKSDVFMHVTNYDDVMLYLRRYMGDSNIVLCADCGCPIEKTSNKKTLCRECAAERKRVSNQNSKKRVTVA